MAEWVGFAAGLREGGMAEWACWARPKPREGREVGHQAKIREREGVKFFFLFFFLFPNSFQTI
jgi:hypothetical protein